MKFEYNILQDTFSKFTEAYNYNSGNLQEYIVIDYSLNNNLNHTIAQYNNSTAKQSVHFIISKTGIITQMIPLNCSAVYINPASKINNSNSIIIMLVNQGQLVPHPKINGFVPKFSNTNNPKCVAKSDIEEFDAFKISYWDKYPELQMESLKQLIAAINDSCYKRLEVKKCYEFIYGFPTKVPEMLGPGVNFQL